jgi:hypothetical protein
MVHFVMKTAAALVATTSLACAAEPLGNRAVVEKMPGLIAFWVFGEEGGWPRGGFVATLRPMR